MRFLLAILLAAMLLLIQARLWAGAESSISQVHRLRLQLAEQIQSNKEAQQRNAQLRAEVQDLREGTEILEEQARHELGMVKPDEVLVQFR